jgi:hypothetical protein
MSKVRSFGHEEREIVRSEMRKVEVPDEIVMVWELELVVALVVVEFRGVVFVPVAGVLMEGVPLEGVPLEGVLVEGVFVEDELVEGVLVDMAGADGRRTGGRHSKVGAKDSRGGLKGRLEQERQDRGRRAQEKQELESS